jgi:hypothetical protein
VAREPASRPLPPEPVAAAAGGRFARSFCRPPQTSGLEGAVAIRRPGSDGVLDKRFGDLEKFLTNEKLRNNTILIFMTDNGGTAGVNVFNAGLRGHKTESYDGGHRVPCWIRWPSGNLGEPRDIEFPTQNTDLLPTLCDLCSVPQPKSARADDLYHGMSLAQTLGGTKNERPNRKLVVQYGQVPKKFDSCVIWNKWRLVKGEELYDIEADRAQKVNIANRHPDVLKEMRDYYEAWWAGLEPTLNEFVPISIGARQQPVVELTSGDWEGIYADNTGHIREAVGGSAGGHWHILVEEPGDYEFVLRRWPEQAATALGDKYEPSVRSPATRPNLKTVSFPTIALAKLAIAGVKAETKADAKATSASLSVKLPAGKTKLEARFADAGGKDLCGAFFVTVRKKGPAPAADEKVGMFEHHADVGTVLHAGSATYDQATKTYTLTGSGENMWFATDAFHFAWAKVTGDVSLTADIAFAGVGKNPHRKAVLMFRERLEADAVYVDVAVHGDGLTSLQFRDATGANTHEVQSNMSAPARVRLVRRGQYALLYAAAKGQELKFTGAAVRLAFTGPIYAGIGVCSHDKDVTETAMFSNVDLATKLPATRPVLYSTLETQAMNSTDRRVVYVTPSRIEAPTWLRDGRTLVYNSGGHLYRIPAIGGTPEVIDTGFAVRCNNDHGVSPDGSQLVISDHSQGDRKSRIYTLPVGGGTPKLVTPNAPSYWHGWSPDGKTLVFCGERDGEFDVYTIPVEGGPETRLTTAKGLDDGPEYSPDGKHIYFNSERSSRMQIWRMKSDGSMQEQVTDDELNNWFPHVSPDGRSLVFISYEKSVVGHPPDKDVMLRRMMLPDKKIDVLGRFLGGQGTVNVPCWSPDGRRIAFVTYQHAP